MFNLKLEIEKAMENCGDPQIFHRFSVDFYKSKHIIGYINRKLRLQLDFLQFLL